MPRELLDGVVSTVLAQGLQPLPTGTGSSDESLASCRAEEPSDDASAPNSQPLGRYDTFG